MKRSLLALTLIAIASASHCDDGKLIWVEGDEIYPPFETVTISHGHEELWSESNQLDWVVVNQDILDRLNYLLAKSIRTFSAAPWLYEMRGAWTILLDRVELKSLLVPELVREYVMSLDPALINSVELVHGAASYFYGADSAMGAVNILLPRASYGSKLGGTSELVGRVTTLEREQSAWWRASLASRNFAAVGEIAGRDWEDEFSTDSLTREQFLRISGLVSSSLSMSGSLLARHINEMKSNAFLSDFDSQQASVGFDYKRSGVGLTDANLAIAGIELSTEDESANLCERWQWIGGRAVSGFQTGWALKPLLGFEGFWERVKFVYDNEQSEKDSEAKLGAGFALVKFQPVEKFKLESGFRYDVAQSEHSQYRFVSPTIKASFAQSKIWNFIASYDHSSGGGEDYDVVWDSWKLGVKISDERVRSVVGIGYIDSESNIPYSFGRVRIFLGYNWRFDFSTAWTRWYEDYHHLFGHCAVRFSGIERDWWVEWVSAYASNRRLSGFFWRHDIFARFKFFRYLSLRTGVENIFDKRYLIELMEFEPRNYKFQLEFAFEI